MKVEADGNARDSKAIDQHLFDERGRLQGRELVIEPHHDGTVETGRSKQAQLRSLVGQAKKRFVRLEDGAGVRLEGQHCRWAPKGHRAVHRRCDDRAMAAMYALEIAHGDHGTAKHARMGRRVEPVMNRNEAWRRRRVDQRQ
jgi:hypothetical protein